MHCSRSRSAPSAMLLVVSGSDCCRNKSMSPANCKAAAEQAPASLTKQADVFAETPQSAASASLVQLQSSDLQGLAGQPSAKPSLSDSCPSRRGVRTSSTLACLKTPKTAAACSLARWSGPARSSQTEQVNSSKHFW